MTPRDALPSNSIAALQNRKTPVRRLYRVNIHPARLRLGAWLLCLGGALALTPALALSRAGATGDAVSDSRQAWPQLDPRTLKLRSEAVLVTDVAGNRVYGKNADRAMPIASITKLMTAMVVLDSAVPLDHPITIGPDDRDLLRLTGSRLKAGAATLTRRELLIIALMASENRAAAALGRTTLAGGPEAFVRAMNRKASSLGMTDSRFVDPTGLDAGNLSTPKDLIRLLRAARGYPLIRRATTTPSVEVRAYPDRGPLRYVNTNRLLKSPKWDIGLSKTGYIDEAGRCLVMQTTLYDRGLYIVLLNSFGKLTPFGDSNRLRRWLAEQLGASRGPT